ncbi:MAG: YbhB/YbcL family Raf kinase inhibitor-like protein [Phycisphaerales bacterium]|nr:MAG: YbhB/YbcL family Raf kinase inhibitor-like protein [Phycisphaerales bacterium]
MTMRLHSPAFDSGGRIPTKFTGDGDDLSPPLAWSDPPQGVAQYALIMEDPDAPRPQPWVHWIIHGIPGDVFALPAGVPREDPLGVPPGARQGVNSWGRGQVGYRGPAPPRGHGRHRYFFRLFALDQPLSLAGGIEKEELLKAMKGHTLATAEFMGTYER